MFILNRYLKFYKSNGLMKSIIKVILTPYRTVAKTIYKKKKTDIFSKVSKEDRFSLIYKKNFWTSKESVSGLGSELKNTVNLRKELSNLIKDYKFNKILDAPCGDFNWIKNLISNDIHYIGCDIVNELIKKNKHKYKSQNIDFIILDITVDKLPDADLMICRDCLIHLSFENIKLFFKNFKNSNINYIMLTSYELKDPNQLFINKNIPDGEFREINMSKRPFDLPDPLKKIIDKDEQTKKSAFNCYMNFYSKEQFLEKDF